jgi:branched-chain amino acid transport system substrate-binding protein
LYSILKTLELSLATVLLAVGLFGCDSTISTPAPPTDIVRIVSSMPSKGYAAPQAREIEQTIDLAIQEHSTSLGQWHVEHVALSDSDDESGDWSAAKELSNAERAVNDPSVIAYIGPYNSGAAMVSLPVTNRAGLLQITPSASWPGLSETGWNAGEPDIYYPLGKRNLARMMPPDTVQAQAAVQWALRENKTDIMVLDDGSSYSIGLARTFEESARPYPGLAGASIRISPPELSNLPAQVAASAVFYAPSTVANAIAVAKALQGTSTTVFATDTALDPQFAEAAAPFTGNWLVVSNSADYSDLPAYKVFAQQFEAAYDAMPSQLAANAYDATNLILDSVAKAGKDRTAVMTGVMGSKEYQGTTGVISFDQVTGEPTSWRATGYRLVDGAFQRVAALSNEAVP